MSGFKIVDHFHDQLSSILEIRRDFPFAVFILDSQTETAPVFNFEAIWPEPYQCQFFVFGTHSFTSVGHLSIQNGRGIKKPQPEFLRAGAEWKFLTPSRQGQGLIQDPIGYRATT